jgi:nitroreductase
MELMEAIIGRRSTRVFLQKSISDETIKKLIEAARWAPSAGNIQPWIFLVIRKREIKILLAEAALNQMFVAEAPVVIVVCADEKRSLMSYGVRGKSLYCIQDTAAATQNLLLMAYALELGTCWVGAFNETEAKKALRLPEWIRPLSLIPLGYPKEKPSQKQRRPVSEIVHYEEF